MELLTLFSASTVRDIWHETCCISFTNVTLHEKYKKNLWASVVHPISMRSTAFCHIFSPLSYMFDRAGSMRSQALSTHSKVLLFLTSSWAFSYRFFNNFFFIESSYNVFRGLCWCSKMLFWCLLSLNISN